MRGAPGWVAEVLFARYPREPTDKKLSKYWRPTSVVAGVPESLA